MYTGLRRYSQALFDKVLIANRGEIACRVMRTCKSLGIKTVAVYSEADKNAMHVQQADEAYLLGPAPSSESYLVQEKILDIAKKSGAQAIHPGYGFLSENAGFADLVARSNIEFIGPPSQAIIDMGSKSASKKIMEKANVPVVPGYHGENQSPAFLKEQAKKITYPVLIKAIKGGGGKGMRIVETEDDFDMMLESAKREAKKSFGDDKVLVEKYIARPRHVEVQVFADKHGNAVYLFERDCSVQRRHQKILEEAPAPSLSLELRQSLGEKAVAAAKAVKYVGAGTVEFILDTDTNAFYFMEMNTRLQVEHPVTEMITGTDLVDWQLRVAAGHRLPKLQNDLVCTGHAFEARIYAENPRKNFLPDTGPLLHLSTPEPSSTVRIETGVRQGDQVSVYYDPMISKLVVHGPDRNSALRILRKALSEFQVVGLETNIEFLKSLSSHQAFIDADVHTGFIKKHESELFPTIGQVPAVIAARAALHLYTNQLVKDTTPWGSLYGFSNSVSLSKTFTLLDEKDPVTVTIKGRPSDLTVSVKRKDSNTVLNVEMSDKIFIQGEYTTAQVVQDQDKLVIFDKGNKYQLSIQTPSYEASTSADLSHSIVTPMPCKVAQVNVKAGDQVKKGQVLFILEAMKMEHVIRAPADAKIAKVFFKANDLVAQGKKLVDFEA